MVDQATIQAKVDKGFAIAAQKIGVPCQRYRPAGPISPLAFGNLLGTLRVLFDTRTNLSQTTPRQRQKPEEWYGAFDTTNVQIGDYLVTPTPETYFVTTLDPFRPPRLVLTNQLVDIHAPAVIPTAGLTQGYGGDIRLNETVVAQGWPASLLSGPRRETGDAKAPGDVKLPWEALLLPPIPGVTLRNDMIVLYATAEGTFRLILSAVDKTSLGYACTAVLETA